MAFDYSTAPFLIYLTLLPGDYKRGITFCEWFTGKCDENRDFININCSLDGQKLFV